MKFYCHSLLMACLQSFQTLQFSSWPVQSYLLFYHHVVLILIFCLRCWLFCQSNKALELVLRRLRWIRTIRIIYFLLFRTNLNEFKLLEQISVSEFLAWSYDGWLGGMVTHDGMTELLGHAWKSRHFRIALAFDVFRTWNWLSTDAWIQGAYQVD